MTTDNEAVGVSVGNHEVSETTEEDGPERRFQDLVIKFSNLKTLLEPGAGRIGNAYPQDICHKIGSTDYAILIGVSSQDYIPTSSAGLPPENDARIMSDICRIRLGIKPSRVKLLTSHTKKPSRSNIRKALIEGFKAVDKDDLMIIYFSGHGFSRKDEHYLIPQDFRPDDFKGTGISAKSMYKWMEGSRCNKIVFVLDCCYAELFTEALYRVRAGRESDKNLYLLASSEVDEPTVSDECWLEHGYMTFFIKHFFNFICDSEQQLSMRKMSRFVKKYSEPLSRFTYTVYDGQVTQIPVLAHLGPKNLVEVDGLGPAPVPPTVDQSLVKSWRERITKSSAYNTWWQERLTDAKVLLEDPLFSYSRMYFVLFLNGLHSLCILLCEQDSIHHDLEDTASYDAFCEALETLVDNDLSCFTHPAYERYHPGEGISNPLYVIRGGVSEGIRSVSQPTAPQEEFVCTETLQV